MPSFDAKLNQLVLACNESKPGADLVILQRHCTLIRVVERKLACNLKPTKAQLERVEELYTEYFEGTAKEFIEDDEENDSYVAAKLGKGCPEIGQKCTTEECEWWIKETVTHGSGCAVRVNAEAMDELAFGDEPREDETQVGG